MNGTPPPVFASRGWVGYRLACSGVRHITLPTGSGWRAGLRQDVGADLLIEDGQRTFAVNEIMVRALWRQRGYARALHDVLLRDRAEERATLLVEPDNVPARSAYLSWGWRKIDDLSWRQPWLDLVGQVTRSGVSMTRVRVATVPHTDDDLFGMVCPEGDPQ